MCESNTGHSFLGKKLRYLQHNGSRRVGFVGEGDLICLPLPRAEKTRTA